MASKTLSRQFRTKLARWLHALADVIAAEPFRVERYLPADSQALGDVERRLRRNLEWRVDLLHGGRG